MDENRWNDKMHQNNNKSPNSFNHTMIDILKRQFKSRNNIKEAVRLIAHIILWIA